MKSIEFTPEELNAIAESLHQTILDGLAEGDSDPTVTALRKIAPHDPLISSNTDDEDDFELEAAQ